MYDALAFAKSCSCPRILRIPSEHHHARDMGTATKVSIIIALCSTNPSVGYEPAPNACPPNVDTALAKPTMIEFPVTLPRVVASAAAELSCIVAMAPA